MSRRTKAFFAYPSQPTPIRDIATSIVDKTPFDLQLWENNDIAGLPFVDPIFEHIDVSDFVIADITRLNFNVTLEIGFAIAKKKRCLLLNNVGLTSDATLRSHVGVFDSLGYLPYENSLQLIEQITKFDPTKHIPTDYPLDNTTPVYLLETPTRNEAMITIASRLKKARLFYRSFNPEEHTRLAALEAVEHVAKSYGVLVPLLSSDIRDNEIHNARAAFVIGLSLGLGKSLLVLQSYGGPVGSDIRDFVQTYKHPHDITNFIHDFAIEVTESLQVEEQVPAGTGGILQRLFLGDPMAENEFQEITKYYLLTDEYNRTARGEANIVVGRKGTGKTALFAQLRNTKRSNKQNLIIDLIPQGYQLTKLRDEVVFFLTEGTKYHLIEAFWEYLFYLEIAYKIIESDRKRHLADHEIFEPYRKISEKYWTLAQVGEGDFSERLLRIAERLIAEYKSSYHQTLNQFLKDEQLTNLLYQTEIRELRNDIASYLTHKQETWIIFDNLDKGWPSTGLNESDIQIIRCLIEASRKMKNDIRNKGANFYSVVLIRDDIYDLLLAGTPDFGKELRVQLSWRDPDMMRELLRRRFIYGTGNSDVSFADMWREICISHIKGEESSQYLIDRTLMRPRNLIKLLHYCRGSAINVGHTRIEASDIEKGLYSYSTDLLLEISRELSDVSLTSANMLFEFVREDSEYWADDLRAFFELRSVKADQIDSIIDHLMFYGFIGMKDEQGTERYIWNYNFNLKLMKAAFAKTVSKHRIVINPAFHPALEIGTDQLLLKV